MNNIVYGGKIYEKLSVDVSQANVFAPPLVKEGDSGTRGLIITVTNNGEPIEIPDSATAWLNCSNTSDKEKHASVKGVINEDSTVTVDVPTVVMEVPGIIECDISIITLSESDQTEILKSTLFCLSCEKAANKSGTSTEAEDSILAGIAAGEITIPAAKGDPGPQGEQGIQGPTGADGYSPTATVTKSGNTATITITDKNGTTTAEIEDCVADVSPNGTSTSKIPHIDTATSNKVIYRVWTDGTMDIEENQPLGWLIYCGGEGLEKGKQVYIRYNAMPMQRVCTINNHVRTWGGWEPLNNATIIDYGTVPESEEWDNTIPTTYAGRTGSVGELALYYDDTGVPSLWYLADRAVNYYEWTKLLDSNVSGYMTLAPLNPTAEEIAAMPIGQLYSDTVNHKGELKGGQSFYDTVYIDENYRKTYTSVHNPPIFVPTNDVHATVEDSIFKVGDRWRNNSSSEGNGVYVLRTITLSVDHFTYDWVLEYEKWYRYVNQGPIPSVQRIDEVQYQQGVRRWYETPHYLEGVVLYEVSQDLVGTIQKVYKCFATRVSGYQLLTYWAEISVPENYYTKTEINSMIGDIETALSEV